ncbi:MAG: hypothetical protein EPO01_00850 [Aquabacterium sp.]|nr:MAG: hypothetical protein EPO01_00850 [Aquabacterium sp.]
MSQPSATAVPRIAPAAAPLSPALTQRLSRLLPPSLPPPQLFLTVARNEGLFNFMVDSGWLGQSGLLDRRHLPRPLREALILRTCTASRNGYEFNLHEQTISRAMGLSDAQIESLRNAPPGWPQPDAAALWTDAELAALRLVDALVSRLDLDDAGFDELRLHHGEAEIVEMTLLIGVYTGVAMLVAVARPAWDDYRPWLARS